MGRLAVLLLILARLTVKSTADWNHWGKDLNNQRYTELKCLSKDALKDGLKLKWTFTTAGTVIPTPSACGSAIYFPDTAGFIYKVGRDGKLQWKFHLESVKIPKQKGAARIHARASPILSPDCKTAYILPQLSQGAWIVALDTEDGEPIYVKQLHDHPRAHVVMSGVLYKGFIYVGAASTTDSIGMSDTVKDFRGVFMRVNATKGTVVWKKYTCPEGYTGCGVWGSSPVIDTTRNQVCIGTGNNQQVPSKVHKCVRAAGQDYKAQSRCGPKDNLVDAVVCFNIPNGNINWARNLHGIDIWMPNHRHGPNSDFAQAPILIKQAGASFDFLIATSKSGLPIALFAKNGKTKWGPVDRTPEHKHGHAMFGSCSTGRTYCYGLHYQQTPWQPKLGVVACLDTVTGRRKWMWATDGGGILGPLTCTSKVVFAPVMDKEGSLVALDIKSGKELGRYKTGQTLFSGPSIVDGVAYIGSGYPVDGGVPDNKVHAIELPLSGTCT